MRPSAIGQAAKVAGRPILLAHRGLHGSQHGSHKENSLAALRAVVGSALDGSELDIRFSADGVPMLMHDATLERTHADLRSVVDLDAEHLGLLGVPTLRDLLELLPRGALLDIELKEPAAPALFSVVEELRGANAEGVVFSSFDQGALLALGAVEPGWSRWLNVDASAEEHGVTVDRLVALGCSGVAVEKGMFESDLVTQASAAGLEVALWTLRTKADRALLESATLVAACLEGEAL